MNEKANENSWFPLIVVACASFIIVLDSFFMNVSISRIVVDLNTDVSTIQMIVSFCTLITAALILLSTKLQDIVGKKKLFLIGATLFGIGIFAAVISSSVIMFFVGWSAIKGIAAALMLPAIVSIISGTYSGKKRTIALATLGMMAGLADVVAPFLGGVITTFLSWRFTFAFELIFILFILVMQHKIPDFKPTESKNDLDIAGAIISGIGLVLDPGDRCAFNRHRCDLERPGDRPARAENDRSDLGQRDRRLEPRRLRSRYLQVFGRIIKKSISRRSERPRLLPDGRKRAVPGAKKERDTV